MDIYNKDQTLSDIKQKIKENKEDLIKTYKELSKSKENNKYLKDVYNDYEDYKNSIIKSKKLQETQILSLLHYLEKSMTEGSLTERMLKEAKNEETLLLNKLNKIRNEIKDIQDNNKIQDNNMVEN